MQMRAARKSLQLGSKNRPRETRFPLHLPKSLTNSHAQVTFWILVFNEITICSELGNK